MLLFIVVVIPSDAQLSDRTGLQQRFSVETGGYTFEVLTVSNFNILDIDFNENEKKLTFYIDSEVEENLSEMQIPKNLIGGNFTFLLNDEEIPFKVRGNDNISFITIEFPGNGTHKLDVIGTTYLPEFSEFASLILATSILGILLLSIKRKRMKSLFVN
jgi:hypothetical protein